VEQLLDAGAGALIAVPGIGEKKAEAILESAGRSLEVVEEARRQFILREQALLDEERARRERLFSDDEEEGEGDDEGTEGARVGEEPIVELTFSDPEEDEEDDCPGAEHKGQPPGGSGADA